MKFRRQLHFSFYHSFQFIIQQDVRPTFWGESNPSAICCRALVVLCVDIFTNKVTELYFHSVCLFYLVVYQTIHCK
jgi:hypothetical protein